MDKQLSERIENQISELSKQQKILSNCIAVVGLVGLCLVLFGVYVNSLEDTEMHRIVSPELDWTIIGSVIIFCCYCIIGLSKLTLSYHIWKLKKELLSANRYYAYRYVHPVEENNSLFVNEELLTNLQNKEY